MISVGRQLDWSCNPLEALSRWPADRRVVLLHSGRYDAQWAKRSILAEPMGTYRFDESVPSGASRLILPDPHGVSPHSHVFKNTRMSSTPQFSHKPFTDLRRILGNRDDGLWIGYLSYDLGRWVETLPRRARDDRGWPIIELTRCPGYLVYDLATRRWTACGAWADDPPTLDTPKSRPTSYRTSQPQSVFTREAYEAAVACAMEYVAAGDAFQVCLAQRFTADFRGVYPIAQRALFGRLATRSPAWFGAYLELDDGRVIASTSPELFLSVDNIGRVVTRPIKGTRPASAPARQLLHSPKDTAELNMIVDLMRNDLGRVCAYGSVRVPHSRIIESHPTIHHGVATITGRLHHRKDPIDLLRATMPGGSVTGAPKIRAMEIIDQLEPVRRGPYCGCIGFIAPDEMCFNITIRTMMIDAQHERIDYSVGGGIVADSDPATEYDETIDKAQAMLTALQPFTTVQSAQLV